MSICGGKILSVTVTIVGILISLVLVIIGLKMGVFTSPETLQMFLRGAGLWAPLVFVGIQVVQVVFPIIPGGLTCIAGVLLFGPVWGFVYNYVGICIGSCIQFSLQNNMAVPLWSGLFRKKCGENTSNGWILQNLICILRWQSFFRWPQMIFSACWQG